MSATIECLEIRRVDGRGNLRAFAKVRLGCIVIHGCRVVQQDGRKPWVALPQTPGRKKADGSGAGWFPVVEITNRAVMERLRDVVLDAWRPRQEIIPPPSQSRPGPERDEAPPFDDIAEAYEDLTGEPYPGSGR